MERKRRRGAAGYGLTRVERALQKSAHRRTRTAAPEEIRHRWYLSSALASLLFHVLITVVLFLVPGLVQHRSQAVVVDTRLTDLKENLQFTQVLDLDTIEVGDTARALSPLSSAAPSAMIEEQDPADELPEEVLPDPELPAVAKIDLPRSDQLTTSVSVQGATGEFVGGVEGAVDRLTVEILRSLERNKTLVVWIFDSTESLRDEREAIAKRFERVYRELAAFGKTEGDELLTAVVSFGKKPQVLTKKPLTDVKKLQETVRNIPLDTSGEEYVFTAIQTAAEAFGAYRTRGRRDLMFIVLTDEVGDDEGRVDDVLPILQKLKVRVYVLGAEALWGKRTTTIPYRDENGRVLGYPEVTRGPESAMIEVAHLPIWHGGNPGLLRSGFGTWGLTRLCRETGGIYFIVDFGDMNGPSFDRIALQALEPDYVSRREYTARASRSPFRTALLQVAASVKVRTRPPRLLFPAYDKNVMSEAMKQAQGEAAILKAQVDPAVSMLARVEKLRDKEKSTRWRAHFDLMFGRLLAAKVRAYTYNAMLAQMRVAPKAFSNKKNNAWRLVPDENIPEDTPAGFALVEAARKAREYLERCATEYAGTPWGYLAEKELEYPLGFRWEEAYVPPPPPRRQDNNRARPRPRPNRPRPLPGPPARPVPKKI